MSSVVRRLPSRASLLSLSEAAASPVMSSHALFEAFVSGRTTPVTTTGSTSGGATGGSFRVTPPPCSPLLRQTPPPNRPGQHSQHHSAFATAYFGTRSTAEAFAEYHAHRAADASVRLRSVEVAAMRRAARLRQVRTRQHAAESHRQYVARRAMQRLQEAQKKIEDRLALAEERRSTVIEQRVEAQRRAEARRAAVRDRLQLLKRAGEVVRSSDCRVACEAIAPLTRLVDATLEEARRNGDADAYINGPVGAPMPLPDSLHGRFVFHSALEKVEAILVADARQVLPGAVSDLLDILLTAADAAASDSPQGSPEKRRGAQHVDPTIAPSAEPKWAQLHDPEYRLKAAMLVIVAHHGAIEAVAPARSDAAWEASKAAFDVVDRLSYIVKCSLAVPAAVETATSVVDTASRVQVRELLDAVVHHVEVVAATKALRQAQMLTELTQALVQLRLGEAARQRDIARTTQRAVAAGAGSPEARRERQVAPRRSVLTSAVASQIEKVLRRLHAVGGADAVRAAEHAALAALAQYEMDVAAASAAATTAATATPI